VGRPEGAGYGDNVEVRGREGVVPPLPPSPICTCMPTFVILRNQGFWFLTSSEVSPVKFWSHNEDCYTYLVFNGISADIICNKNKDW
jgi:hypothetical protein